MIRTTTEKLVLPPVAPRGFAVGARLSEASAWWTPPGGEPYPIPAYGAVDPDSIEIRCDGRLLSRGTDWLVDEAWGSLGTGTAPSFPEGTTVEVTYTYSKLRLDSIVRRADGSAYTATGEPHLTCPLPPAIGDGEMRVANVFYDRFDQTGDEYPITAAAADAPTASTPGRLPRTLAKLQSGEPLKIVCWGDSVTVGGDATDGNRYADVWSCRMREQFPNANVDIEVTAVGGSNSTHWLNAQGACDFQRVIDARPDLVSIEFVNDAALDPDSWADLYADTFSRLAPIDPEVILITPSWTAGFWMQGYAGMRGSDNRGYTAFLRRLAGERHLALADASARWEHLWREGLPYITLLWNSINHPDDRGHALFADELMKCLQ